MLYAHVINWIRDEKIVGTYGRDVLPYKPPFAMEKTRIQEFSDEGRERASRQMSQSMPIKVGARIGLATGSDMTMPGHCRNRVVLAEDSGKSVQREVLSLFEGLLVTTLQLDTDGKIITTIAPFPRRDSCMPGTIITGNTLNQLSVTTDQEMR